MTLQAYLFTLLTSDAAVSAIVSTRVYEGIVPQSSAYPAISYSLVSRDGECDTLEGADASVVHRVQINAYASTGVVREALAAAVRDCLNGKRESAGVELQEAWLENELDRDEPMPGNEAQRLYGRTMDFLIAHVE